MRLYKCDRCGEHIGEDEVIVGCVMYMRTSEEIKELLKTAPRGTSYGLMRAKSIVVKNFEHCKKCNALLKEVFEKPKKTK